ncbi:hypothetical protein CAL7716_107700 (plasmid) [Calothrix sp. PCC 7716]|nr:hypothetical protein CAL7716_107700 [Calothrix sp. PCC 7716]
MSKLIPLNKINGGCSVCGKDDGACRQSSTDPDFILCKTNVDARKGERIGDYICVKESNGHTASFKLSTEDWSEDAKREYKTKQLQEQQLREKRQEAEYKERLSRALPNSERHQAYLEIHNQLTLDAATVTDLQRRGFSEEEITNSGFVSVHKYQKLNKAFDIRLPGVTQSGDKLAIGTDGYLCPVRDFDGNITAFQLRVHVPEDGNRYKWLSTPDKATLKLQPEDENPLAVFHPTGECKGIAIVEGTGPKPYFVAQRLGFLTIGAAGGQWLGSPQLLEKYIKQAKEKYGASLPIYIIPDAGFALNPGVIRNLLTTTEWLQKQFKDTQICVSDWNQIDKSQGDIDELEDLSIVRTLKLESFFKKYKEVLNVSKGFANKPYQEWAKSRVKLTADIVQHEKWLTIPQGIQDECDILLVRKALGGGKTQALIEFLKPIDTVSVLVGYRNTLGNNTVNRANEMGLSAQHIKDMAEVMDGYYVNFADDESIKLWFGCADSYPKFNAIINRNPNYYLIHDEICSVLGHLKGGGTLKGRQKQAIEWDVNTIQNSQFSIMMDANLSDREVDFIHQLFPNKRIKVLDSHYPTNPRTFYFLETASEKKDYTASSKYLPSGLIEKAKSANKILWLSDSQRSCEVADEILTEHGHKHYRLDGKTSHDELSKELQSAPKQFILTQKLDSLSLSPSGESGLSIDAYDYFDAVCFDIRGTVSVNTLTQLSARLRDTKVPIYVACPEFVNMTSNPCPYAISSVKEVINQRIEMLMAKSMEVDGELVNSEFVANMFTDMGNHFSGDPWFIESLKDSKQLKYEHLNLKLMLKTALAQAGHRIIDLVESADENLYDECQTAKENVKKREAEKVFKSQDIDWEKAQELSKKDINYDDKCKVRKARIKHKLPGIEETSSWSADFFYSFDVDDTKFLDAHWRLMQLENTELANAVFKMEKKFNFEKGFTAQDAWKSTSTKIEALKQLGIDKLINADVFSTTDEWVLSIVNEYYDKLSWFELIGISKPKRTLNADGSPKNLKYVKDTINKFLDYFGLETVQVSKSGNTRYYKVVAPEKFESFLPDIDNCFARRVENTIALAKDISLKESADKAEEALRQQQEWEQKHQAELNKRMLESQLKQTQYDSDATLTPAEIAASQLRALRNWSDCTLSQEEINLGWELLNAREQEYLNNLYEFWRQSQQQNNAYDVIQQAIDSQASVKEIGFGSEHFRSYKILNLLQDGIVWVKQCFGAKIECEMPINLLQVA